MSLINRLVKCSLGRSEEDLEGLLSALNQAGGSDYRNIGVRATIG
jgi:hypothetical protein